LALEIILRKLTNSWIEAAMSKTKKRRAKQSKVKSPGPTAGLDQGSKGPFQGQEIGSSSSSEDSESEEVDVQSGSRKTEVSTPARMREVAEEKQDEVIVEVSRALHEVVVVGVMRFMPEDEIASEAKARSARHINRRVDGALQPTTAVVLRFDADPPEHVVIHQERSRTQMYVHQTSRCFNC